jgi:PBP1b-binding outer membrane lipoprotein LpoB
MKHYYLPFMAIILLASCSQEELQPENYDSEESSNTQEIEANPYEEGVSIVKFDDEMMKESLS